jgi:hypothetical protein
VLVVDIVTAIIAVGTLFFIVIPQPVKTIKSAASSIIREMVEGFSLYLGLERFESANRVVCCYHFFPYSPLYTVACFRESIP